MQLYAIPCTFRIAKDSPIIEGLAVCSDPDTPVTFLYPEGIPYPGRTVWSYNLHRHKPWALLT